MTWEQFGESYRPGHYGNHTTPRGVIDDCQEVSRLLALAQGRMDLIHPREETSAGSCWGEVA